MKKLICLFNIISILFGCHNQTNYISELSDYYISITKSSEQGNKVMYQNVSYDFETLKSTESENVERSSAYPIFVFDQKYNRYIYSSKDESGNDHIYIYDIESNTETHLDLGIWGVNYILIRENDYIVVAVKNKTQILTMYSIDKLTFDFKEIELPTDIHNDMSVWQAFYIPQTDGLIIQTYSVDEEWILRDEWNTQNHAYLEDMEIPYYHYLYTDQGFEFLFKLDMPQSDGILSNGHDVLVALNYINKDDQCVVRYNLESEEISTEEYAKSLNLGFYLDNEGRYVYALGDNIHKYDTYTGKDTVLDITFPYEGYNSNYVLVKK